jgi:hypothetical protein
MALPRRAAQTFTSAGLKMLADDRPNGKPDSQTSQEQQRTLKEIAAASTEIKNSLKRIEGRANTAIFSGPAYQS